MLLLKIVIGSLLTDEFIIILHMHAALWPVKYKAISIILRAIRSLIFWRKDDICILYLYTCILVDFIAARCSRASSFIFRLSDYNRKSCNPGLLI